MEHLAGRYYLLSIDEIEMFTIFEPDRHYGCRVNDRITWHGFRALILQNELIQVVVLVEKGSEITQFLYKPSDIDFLWHSANPPRDPTHFVVTGGSPAAPFFDHWGGGWFEVLPNGGPGCTYKDAELGQFAETINIPWEYRVSEDHPHQVSVDLWVRTYRTPFLLQKTLTLKSGIPVLFLQERVTNEGRESMEYMWGHHPVIGAPFLDETCQLFAPPSKVEVFNAEDGPDHRMGLNQIADWPVIRDRDGKLLDLSKMPPRRNKTMDNCYLKDFEQGWAGVYNPGKEVGFGLAWDAQVFRYIWLWQALGGGVGYPWYGRTYCMGIEPWNSYPCVGLAETVARGTAATLGPGEYQEVWLAAAAFTEIEQITQIHRNEAEHKTFQENYVINH